MIVRLFIFSVAIFVGIIPAFAKKKVTPWPAPPHVTTTGRNYISALAATNHLMQAWQTGDQEAALVLLTDTLKHRVSAEQLEKMFSPQAPVQRAYQIEHGRRLAKGRYAFPVTLYEAEQDGPMRTISSQIQVVLHGKEDWAIDRLP